MFLANLDFGQNCRKTLDLGAHFRKVSILVKIFEKSRSWSKLWKILDFAIIWKKNIDFTILDFGKKFPKISRFVEFLQISNLVKNCKNLDFGPNFSENLDSGLDFRKSSILVKTVENLDFSKKKL